MPSECTRRRIPRWPLSLAIPFLLLGLLWSEQSAWTDDEPAPAVDPFAIPENPSGLSLNLFISRLMRTRPEGDVDARREHFARVEAAADELLKLELETDPLLKVIELKQGSMVLQEQLGDDTAAERQRAFLDTLLQDERVDVLAAARRLDEIYRTEHLATYTEEERQAMVDAVVAQLERQVGPESNRSAFRLAGALERVDPQLAVTAYNSFSELLEQGPRPSAPDDVNYQEAAEIMRAAARRLDLPGKPIEVKGTTFEGDEFDITDLRGKVVLVDFWATWCGPCIDELPHVKELYEQHHDDGFEVVGISLDESDTGLARFLEEQEIPWITLFEADPEKRGFASPIVNHYGINELPTAILVDREGKVVSVNAIGEGLAELLEKHLSRSNSR